MGKIAGLWISLQISIQGNPTCIPLLTKIEPFQGLTDDAYTLNKLEENAMLCSAPDFTKGMQKLKQLFLLIKKPIKIIHSFNSLWLT